MAYLPAVRSTVDASNSTTTTLLATEVFEGAWFDVTAWNGISVQLDGTSATVSPGTLEMEFSHDGVSVHRNIPITVSDVSDTNPRTLGTVARYFRVRYTNGAVDQTSFSLQTMHHSSEVSLVSRLDQVLDGTEDVSNVRSIPSGQQPDGDFVNARADGTAFTDTTPLGAAGTFQSDWLDTDGFVSVELFIATDELSAVNGIMVEFTDDVQAGLPTVRASESYTFAQRDIDRGYLSISFPTRLDGFRVTYTNGASPQGSFFIQTDLRTNSSPIRLDQSGAVITTDFEIEVALGNIPNHTNGTKFGSVIDIGSGDVPVTIWRAADSASAFDRKTFQTVAANAWVCGTGAGTQQITLIVNNASNALEIVTVNLTGTTPVDTGVSVLDCNTAYVSGTDETLAGDVWITNANNFTVGGVPVDPTEVLAFIPQADQRTQQAVYRVPAGTTMVIRNIHAASAISTGQGRMSLKMRVKPPNGSWYVLRPFIMSTNFTLERDEVMTFAAGTLIEFYLDASANGSDTTVIFNYDLITGA